MQSTKKTPKTKKSRVPKHRHLRVLKANLNQILRGHAHLCLNLTNTTYIRDSENTYSFATSSSRPLSIIHGIHTLLYVSL